MTLILSMMKIFIISVAKVRIYFYLPNFSTKNVVSLSVIRSSTLTFRVRRDPKPYRGKMIGLRANCKCSMVLKEQKRDVQPIKMVVLWLIGAWTRFKIVFHTIVCRQPAHLSEMHDNVLTFRDNIPNPCFYR